MPQALGVRTGHGVQFRLTNGDLSMKLIHKVLDSLSTATDKATDAVVTTASVVDTTLKSAHDYSSILRQESMKAVIGADNEGKMTDEQIEEYFERKAKLLSIDKRLNELMRS